MTNAQQIASAIQAMNNCEKMGNLEWFNRWEALLCSIMKNGPSGSGIDCGTTLKDDWETDKPVTWFSVECSYHHMDDSGMYDGWTEHTIKVSPDWQGVNLKISGENRNEIQDYLLDVYSAWLEEECTITA